MKPVNYKLIQRGDDTDGLYAMLDDLIEKYHIHLQGVAFLIWWRGNWRPDKDGYIHMAQVRKATDFDRELVEHDLSLLLNRERWGELSTAQQRAWMDKALCRVVRDEDKHGDPKEDDAGRPLFRLRKAEVEEYTGVVRRHGMYTAQLQDFVTAALKGQKRINQGLGEEELTDDSDSQDDNGKDADEATGIGSDPVLSQDDHQSPSDAG